MSVLCYISMNMCFFTYDSLFTACPMLLVITCPVPSWKGFPNIFGKKLKLAF